VNVLGESLWQGESPFSTDRAGFPLERHARYIGWAFLLPGALLHGLLSGLWVIQLAVLLGPALGAAAAVCLFLRLNDQLARTSVILAGVFFGLAPVTLGAALSGQIENTQSWVLPLLLWVVLRGSERGQVWALVGAAWIVGAFTSPYLAMTAALALPWLLWQGDWRKLWAPALVGVVAMAAAGWWLAPEHFESSAHIFKPAYGRGELPHLWSDPLPLADLDTLFGGRGETQPRHAVLHQPYLGLVLLVSALVLGQERKKWIAPILIGAIMAMGPTLAWHAKPVLIGGSSVPLPARIFQWLDLPPAHGGQYYRFVILAHLGLAGLLASARPRRGLPLLIVLGAFDVGRSVAAYGIPWPVQELPRTAWQQWAEDPVPGAVVHIPMLSQHTPPCNPIRLSGQGTHLRSMAALPRGHTDALDTPLLGQLDLCTRRGQGCALPPLEALHEAGFRYVVLDLPQVPERMALAHRLDRQWGPPDAVVGDLSWWVTEPGEEP
jgi:hypothetical protein